MLREEISPALSGMGASLRQAGGALRTISASTELDWDQVRAALKGTDAGRGLFDSLTDLSGELEDLHAAVDQAVDQLAADLRAISRQFNTVFQVLLNVLSDIQGGADSHDLVEDTSDENIAATRYGKVENCRNEGAVDGDRNVGGIAGLADGMVRESIAKCTLSGADDIGGVSYAGHAQPMTYEELRSLPDIPAEFAAFTLTFRAGETIVKEISFTYGRDLSVIELPPVPEREGFYGEWQPFDTSGLRSDVLVEAACTPWITLVASGEQDGELALALAEGQFTGEAALHVQPNPFGTSETVCAWDVTLTGSDLGPEAEVPLRLLNRLEGKAEVRQYRDGQWVPLHAKTNGRYLLVTM